MSKPRLKKGLVQVYTGDGKGKTTAAMGQALRAIGRGLRVYVGQFIKGRETGEMLALQRLQPNIIFRQFGSGKFIRDRRPDPEELAAASQAWNEIISVVDNGEFDMVILDEISHAVRTGLIELEKVKEVIVSRPSHVELILTGRNMPQELIELADLVTEMVAVKHPLDRGVPARKGIEF